MSVLANDSLTGPKQHYIKLKYDDKVIFHEEVDEGKIIQITNADGEILESEVLKRELEFEINDPEIPKGFILSYWDIQDDKNTLKVSPVLTEAKSVNITFTSLEGGELIQNNALTSYLKKSTDEGTPLNDVLPETNPQNNWKLSGWFSKDKNDQYKEIDDLNALVTRNAEYYAIFYPDLNDNNIDDRTEEITVKFIYNVDDKTKEESIHVGETVKLPRPDRKNYIFMGWYLDEEFKEQYNHSAIIEDTVLYGKWEKAEKVVKDSEEKAITDQDISDQIEQYLTQQQQGTPQSSDNGKNDDDKNNNDSKEDDDKNENDKNDDNKEDDDKNENDKNDDSKEDDGKNDNEKNDDSKDDAENRNSEGNNLEFFEGSEGNKENNSIYTEDTYVFKNDNVGERYMIKFYDADNRFLFSLTLPYGRAIQILHENGNVLKEYAVRQNTTIHLNVDEYVNDVSKFLEFTSRTKRVNSTSITEVKPSVHYEPEQAVSTAFESNDKNESRLVTIVTVALTFVGIIILLIYFMLKRRKKTDVVNVK